jgi:hypothetical protein
MLQLDFASNDGHLRTSHGERATHGQMILARDHEEHLGRHLD